MCRVSLSRENRRGCIPRVGHVMKRSLGLQLLFFVFMAALLVGVAMGIHPRAITEVGTICSAGAPARSVQPAASAKVSRVDSALRPVTSPGRQ